MEYDNKNQIALAISLANEAAQLREKAKQKDKEATELVEGLQAKHGDNFVCENKAYTIQHVQGRGLRILPATRFKSIK